MAERLHAAIPLAACLVVGSSAFGQHEGVAATVHNLSVTGPGEFRATSETQICKFCHIPHNAVVPEQLWGRRLPDSVYELPAGRRDASVRTRATQPDGSSRMCLSCHDGTIALGEVAREPREIRMAGSQRLGPGHRGFLGTDLTGSHAISFVVPDGDPVDVEPGRDMGLKPLSSIEADGDVKLDGQGKMQCTTCHDPHSDVNFVEGEVPRFWVKSSVSEVCFTCHDLR